VPESAQSRDGEKSLYFFLAFSSFSGPPIAFSMSLKKSLIAESAPVSVIVPCPGTSVSAVYLPRRSSAAFTQSECWRRLSQEAPGTSQKDQVPGYKEFALFEVYRDVIVCMGAAHVADPHGFIVKGEFHLLPGLDRDVRVRASASLRFQ